MQPNNQNGYWQPQQDQPVQPSSPPPQQPVSPQVFPVQQPTQSPQPQPIEYQQPISQPQVSPAPQPVYDQPSITPIEPPQVTSVPVEQAVPTPAASPEATQQYVGGDQAPVLDDQQQYTDEETQEYYDEEDQDDQDELVDEDEEEAVNWQATEYIHQEKGAQWFVIFGIVLAVMLVVAIFLMRSPTFAVLLVVVAVTIVVFAKRPPRILSYSLSNKGLHIGDTLHNFANFKSFGVIHDGAEYSVMLIPTKRFQPGVSVYFPEESGEAIVDMLGSRLPMQDLKLDPIDKLTRFLRL